MTRFRLLFAISALVALAALLGACGGDDDGGGGAGEDPQKVLDQTFSSQNEAVDSGNLTIKLNVDASGAQGGSFDAELSGPFENQGEGKVPKLDLSVSASGSGGGQDFSFDGGLISTGDAAFVNYKGTDYEVEQSLFDQFKSSIEQAAAQRGENRNGGQQFLDALGVKDPKELLTNLQNEGEADVAGTNTIRISGDLDVDRTVNALKNLVGSASLLGQFGGDTSDLPSPEQLDQIADAIKEAHFDIYSGADDHILRRLAISFSIEPPQGDVDKLDIGFDFTVSEVNEPQTIEAPSGAKPFRDLLGELGVDPSALGALGIGAQPQSGGAGPATPVTPSTPDTDAAQQYLNCISKAKSAADLQQCQSLAP